MRTLKPLFTIPQRWKPVRCIRARYCSNLANTGVTSKERRTTPDKFKSQVSSGPSFEDFIRGVSVKKTYAADGDCSDHQSYLSEDLEQGNSRKGWSALLNKKNPYQVDLLSAWEKCWAAVLTHCCSVFWNLWMSNECERHRHSLVHTTGEGLSTHRWLKRGTGELLSLYNFKIGLKKKDKPFD